MPVSLWYRQGDRVWGTEATSGPGSAQCWVQLDEHRWGCAGLTRRPHGVAVQPLQFGFCFTPTCTEGWLTSPRDCQLWLKGQIMKAGCWSPKSLRFWWPVDKSVGKPGCCSSLASNPCELSEKQRSRLSSQLPNSDQRFCVSALSCPIPPFNPPSLVVLFWGSCQER